MHARFVHGSCAATDSLSCTNEWRKLVQGLHDKVSSLEKRRGSKGNAKEMESIKSDLKSVQTRLKTLETRLHETKSSLRRDLDSGIDGIMEQLFTVWDEERQNASKNARNSGTCPEKEEDYNPSRETAEDSDASGSMYALVSDGDSSRHSSPR